MEGRPRFFSTVKKGENFELKAELNSEYRDKRKEAVKKVIANMTVGKDVSDLFADVVKNMQTEDLELKKLVYLYLMNYAKTQPELVILVVNSFLKDAEDPSPLIRALAIRTMGCLRAEKIMDYLMEPLKKALADHDAYVRKTAAICVAKMFDMSHSLAIDNGLIEILQEMLSDKNPMVVANVVSALQDISESAAQKNVFVLNNVILAKLLAALNDCTEWGQICILNTLTNYKPTNETEATEIVERVIPRLQHINSSLVLSAIRTILVYLPYITNEETKSSLLKKLSPPLVSLLSTESELQYVALRNINLILQKIPDVFTQDVRVFFIKYTDPPFVKMEKLETIIKLCSDRNIDQVLAELKEYTNEVDVPFVMGSVNAIGRCALNIDACAEKCVTLLLELLKAKVTYVVQQVVIVLKDVLRKYPKKFEHVIPVLCENFDLLTEPEAKASFYWIIGEFSESVDSAFEMLQQSAETLQEESSNAQMQLLTACVKLFLKKPSQGQQLCQNVLNICTSSIENPDIRDRAFLFKRLVENRQVANSVVFAEKPPVIPDNTTVADIILDDLIADLGSLASVYHISPKSFRYSARGFDDEREGEEIEDAPAETIQTGGVEDLLDLNFAPEPKAPAKQTNDLLSLDLPPAVTSALSQMSFNPAPLVASNTIPASSNNDPLAALAGLSSFTSPSQVSVAPLSNIGFQQSPLTATQSTSSLSKPADPFADLANLTAMSITPKQPSPPSKKPSQNMDFDLLG